MDPYSKYQQQLEYYKYLEQQRENCVQLDDPETSVKELAKYLFGRPVSQLDQNLVGILMEESMKTIDIFCMLLELVLHGLEILTQGQYTIFDLTESTNNMIDIMKTYLRSAGIKLNLREEFFDDAPCLYRDRTDYYCEILPRPSPHLCFSGWYILGYRINENKKFTHTVMTKLNQFKAMFITKQNKIYIMTFEHHIGAPPN